MHRSDEDPEIASAELFDREQISNYLVFIRGAVRRHGRLVVAAMAWVTILTVAVLAALPSTYHVEAKLLAQKNPVLAVRGDGPDANGPTRGAVEIIRRRDSLVALIEGTHLVSHWNAHRAPLYEVMDAIRSVGHVGSSRVDLQACKLEYSIVSPK